ncbi:hypothetical protein ACFFMN_28270 [Planobispora siamensis]|uniref:Uncharacterized protein n=1 Tax=Planobispora siamensis TaxID=936338 RepID=A0A8J3SS87_9ACTN|nr:hypothetical protein [Planobispora siamensis]GIH97765.1 hypothetical protein Psi01_83950 [Planobispora siamensis]
MTDKMDQEEIQMISGVLGGLSPDAHEIIKMILTLEQENLHKAEPTARTSVREEMIKKIEGIA